LNEEEIEYLESLKTITTTDRAVITAFAEKLAAATFTDTSHGVPMVAPIADVTCYRNGRKVTSLRVGAGFLVADRRRWFDYSHTGLDPYRLTPEIWPYVVRMRCATNMWRLLGSLDRLSDASGEYPSAEKWADAVCGNYVDLGMDPNAVSVAENFLCPGAGEGPCHFALNPHCKPEFPPDCVLLFEAEAGWNRHGGPELFSSEHHEPRGGHVLLKDGTIKFIRTEEELRGLRWK
jgi:hypothetical protein